MTGMEYVLVEGDTILVGVTHQVEVGRDKSWVKYESQTKVRPDETTDEAQTRAIGHVNAGAMRAVEATVEEIRSRQ